MNAITSLNKLVAATIKTVEHDVTWPNGTGYLDGAVYNQVQAPGQVAKFVDSFDRKGVLIGMPDGTNAVVFQRYNDEQSEIVVMNVSREVNSILAITSSLEYGDLERVIALGNLKFKMPEMA